MRRTASASALAALAAVVSVGASVVGCSGTQRGASSASTTVAGRVSTSPVATTAPAGSSPSASPTASPGSGPGGTTAGGSSPSPSPSTSLSPSSSPGVSTTLSSSPVPSATTLAPVTSAQRAAADSLIEALKRELASARAAQVMIWRGDGQLIGEFRRGQSAGGAPLTADSPFLVASVSKMITGITVLRLVEAGKVDLDQPLLSQAKLGTPHDPRLAEVTVRQVMMQTAGVPELNGSFYSSNRGDWRATVDDVLAAKLVGTPGQRFLYANGNYTLLGALIEHVTGTSYTAAVQKLVFAPLGIDDAVMVGDGTLPPAAPVYGFGKNTAYLANLGPAGGWAISALDARRLTSLRGADGKPILGAATIEQMRTRSGPKSAYVYRYGLGVMNYDEQGWGHTGNVNYVRSFVRGYDNGFVIVMQTSIDRAPSSREIVRRVQAQLNAIRDLPA